MRIDPRLLWMKHAACQGEDPDLFFEAAGEAQAKAICRNCPVEADCYQFALAECIDYGVWGGANPAERRSGGPMRGVIAHGTYGGYRMHLRRKEPTCEACRMANTAYQQSRLAADPEGVRLRRMITQQKYRQRIKERGETA